ncbi:hypothetical protein A0H81_06377 [Grifola frondosa]|uniref:BTB domain-containing protein n=1 Tax=Grifola frondosa TaxID=5627 RepID=A0A1C7MAJ3_GRIFR|nr:hypothetical protein A0H81_06377 [Grifola frondosa]
MSSAPQTEAPAPFNENPGADIDLRTSDGVHFFAHKSNLAQASKVFQTMFTLPQPPSAESTSSLQCVDVSEPAGTLDKLLRMCYPLVDPPLDKTEELCAVLEAAVKYDMEHARAVCIAALMRPERLAKDPFTVYAIAYRFRLEHETRVAARHTLAHHPTSQRSASYQDALAYIPATALYELSIYRGRCVDAAYFVYSLKNDDWWDQHKQTMYNCWDCREYGVAGFISITREDHEAILGQRLESTPCGEKVMDSTALGLAMCTFKPEYEASCKGCREDLVSVVQSIHEHLAGDVDSCIAKVKLNLAF